jgi:HSP20 family molecular chaperone IbpA
MEKREGMPLHREKMNICKTIKFPVEVRPEGVEATLKNGILEPTLPQAEAAKKVKIEVKTL